MRGAVMRVFVLDKNLKPLDPCHPARARELLNKGSGCQRYSLGVVQKNSINWLTCRSWFWWAN
ncbi:RRXRR domain-containing protein [Coleofasciculus sp. G2-EDA-02]|uniref:RRXRR domain-containing protein n=1 Tax=Coleofasciculus sp. G2-EDA-02 TaxID=3069529 RepID=UPI004064447A